MSSGAILGRGEVTGRRNHAGERLSAIAARFRSWVVIGTIVVVWQIVASTGIFLPIMLPKFTDVLGALYNGALSGDLLQAILWSCMRVFAGFFLGLVIAVPLGLLIGWFRIADQLLNPVIEVLRPVPPLAWIPLAVIWLGVGVKSVLFITTLGAFFPIIVATISGVHAVDRKVIEYSRTLGASTAQILHKVVIPAMLPALFVGMRIAVGFTWMVVVAAEMISVKYGLGWMIWKARFSFETETVIAGMIAIGALSVIMTKGMARIEKALFKWREGTVRGA